MKKEKTSGNNLDTVPILQNLITEEFLHDFVSRYARELCCWLNDEIVSASSRAVARKTVPLLDLTRSFKDIPPEERLMLICIDHVRCEYNISGRKWLSVMVAVQRRYPQMNLNEAYGHIKRLYGDNWRFIEFDFYNATRNYSGDPSSNDNPGQEKSMIIYPGVEKKYTEITEKLDALFKEYIPQ